MAAALPLAVAAVRPRLIGVPFPVAIATVLAVDALGWSLAVRPLTAVAAWPPSPITPGGRSPAR